MPRRPAGRALVQESLIAERSRNDFGVRDPAFELGFLLNPLLRRWIDIGQTS